MGKDLVATMMRLESGKNDWGPDFYHLFYNRNSVQFRIIFFDGKLLVPTRLPELVVKGTHLDHPNEEKTLTDLNIFQGQRLKISVGATDLKNP